jgi:uncharacterized hydrophobic protein (TIGR00271 family)
VLEHAMDQLQPRAADFVDGAIVARGVDGALEVVRRGEQWPVLRLDLLDGGQQLRRPVEDVGEEAAVVLGLGDVPLEHPPDLGHPSVDLVAPPMRVDRGGGRERLLQCHDRVVEGVPPDPHRGQDLVVRLLLPVHAAIPAARAPSVLLPRRRGDETGAVLQIRVISPPDLTATVVERLRSDHGTANLSLQPGTAIDPAGDVVVVEIPRERGNAIVDMLVELQIDVFGAISVIDIDTHASRSADIAEEAAAGHGADALMWQELEEHAQSDAHWSVTYYVLMVVASLIAAVAIVLDSPVLVIGAMIVGPEYGPLTAFSVSLYRDHRPDALRAAITLTSGLLLGIIGAAILTLVLEAVGDVSDSFQSSDNFFTAFVSEPNVYSFIVAFLAGIAGTVALAQGRQAALAGVLVSVTTIPAAAAVGVDAAVGDWPDALGAVGQLSINLTALVLASLVTLGIHDRAWRRGRLKPSAPRAPSR